MKKKFILVLVLSTVLLLACKKEYVLPEPDPEFIPAATPSISSFYPGSAASGAIVAIFEENFGASMADNYVTFNGNDAELTQIGIGMVVVRIPLNIAPGDYTITLTANRRIGNSTKAFKVVDAAL